MLPPSQGDKSSHRPVLKSSFFTQWDPSFVINPWLLTGEVFWGVEDYRRDKKET